MNGMVPWKENISPVAINQQLYAVQRHLVLQNNVRYCILIFVVVFVARR